MFIQFLQKLPHSQGELRKLTKQCFSRITRVFEGGVMAEPSDSEQGERGNVIMEK